MASEYEVVETPLGRWIIINARDRELAWSGSCWVEQVVGIGRRVQISNFATQQEAADHAQEVFRK